MSFFEGVGDAASFGLTGVVRRVVSPGSDCFIKHDWTYYAGMAVGTVASAVLTGGEGGAEALAESGSGAARGGAELPLQVPGRLTPEEMAALSEEHGVEYALAYKTGPGTNGGGGTYWLYRGGPRSVKVTPEEDTMLIYHTHPSGRPVASPSDVSWLRQASERGSPQRSSEIVLPNGSTIRFSDVRQGESGAVPVPAGQDASSKGEREDCSMSSIDDYREIWEAPLDKYVIINLDPEVFIFDPVNDSPVAIADIAIEAEVIKRMIERGFAVAEHLPAISTLEDYRYIWNAPLDQYAVVKKGPPMQETFIVGMNPPGMLLMEDDAIIPELIDRMIERGFPVLDQPPWSKKPRREKG